jgi:predicted RNA binding protein YcfA (HicA-like mRNA interferase family)
MPMTGKEMLKLLAKHGWQVVRIKGSHHVLARGDDPTTVSVPVHGNDTPKTRNRTLNPQAGEAQVRDLP